MIMRRLEERRATEDVRFSPNEKSSRWNRKKARAELEIQRRISPRGREGGGLRT